MAFDIRPATPGDAAGIAAIWRVTCPFLVKTAAGIEAQLRAATKRRVLVAENSHGLVGTGSAWAPEPDDPTLTSRVTALVPPRHRRQGFGSALADAVTEAAREFGADRLRTVIDDDAAARDFAVRRGFGVGRRVSYARAALAGVPEPLPAPEGLDLTTYDKLPDPRLVWQAWSEVAADDPSGFSGIGPFEDWLESEWKDPDLAHELSVAALDGDRVVSFSAISADRERGAVWSDMTGTLPEYRGRGLAKVVKSVSLAGCRDAGLIEALTGNDAANQPMLAVNSWLGYRPAAWQWTAEKSL
jgi:GNAT superfamily N-acetyltransferase